MIFLVYVSTVCCDMFPKFTFFNIFLTFDNTSLKTNVYISILVTSLLNSCSESWISNSTDEFRQSEDSFKISYTCLKKFNFF